MKIILLKEVEKLGKRGDITDVKPGYGRHKLIPEKLALLYTSSNLKQFEELTRMESVRENKRKKQIMELKGKLEKLSLTCVLPCGKDGKPFGAVTNMDIEKLLKQEGYEMDKKDILLDEPIKELGVYSVNTKLSSEIEATVRIWVVSK